MTRSDADLENGRRPAGSLTRKEAKIVLLARELAVAAKETKPTAARLLRELDELAAAKNGQIAECLYHLNRVDTSGWWRLGKWLENLALASQRTISKIMPRNVVNRKRHLVADRSYQKSIELYDTISQRDREEIRRHVYDLNHLRGSYART